MPKKKAKKTKAKATKKKTVEISAVKVEQIKPEIKVHETEISEPAQEVEADKVEVQEVKQDIHVDNHVDETKEEQKMEEGKEVGKEYNPAEFSQPAVQAGRGSKIVLYVGISVVVIALIVGGLFLGGIFKKSTSEALTGATVVTAYCIDTDGGYNRFTKGVAEGTYYLNYEDGTYMDECASGEENKLTEYYCKNDLVVYATEPCPQGMTCVDGICQ